MSVALQNAQLAHEQFRLFWAERRCNFAECPAAALYEDTSPFSRSLPLEELPSQPFVRPVLGRTGWQFHYCGFRVPEELSLFEHGCLRWHGTILPAAAMAVATGRLLPTETEPGTTFGAPLSMHGASLGR